MTSRIELDIPVKFPRWATDSGRTLEPDETGTVLSNKDLGWLLGDEPPARWMNWLQNLAYEWIKKAISASIGNFLPGGSLSGTTGNQIVFDAVKKTWFITTDTTIYVTDSLTNVSAVETITGGVPSVNGYAAFNSSHTLFSCPSGVIKYSPDIITWFDEIILQPGADVVCLDTDYPNSDMIVAGNNTPALQYSTTGVGGTWTLSTIPSITGTVFNEVINVDTNEWLALTEDAEVLYSTDNALNYSMFSNLPTGFNSTVEGTRSFDINRDTGRIVVVGTDTTLLGRIQYNDDFGVSAWSTASIELTGIKGTEIRTYRVRHVGGGNWIVACETDTAVTYSMGVSPILISTDDGETWFYGTLQDNTLADDLIYNHVSVSNKIIGILADDKSYARSLTIV